MKDKTYDSTTDAEIDSLSFGSLPYNERLDGKYTASASFDTPDAGSKKTVTVTVTALSSESPASNYVLSTTPGDCTKTKLAGIKEKSLYVSSISVKDKEYDGTNTAELDIALTGVIERDKGKLSATASAAFVDAAVGNDKTVTVSGNIMLTGEAAGNYRLLGNPNTSNLTGDITKKELVISGIAAKNKTYDGTADAELDYADVVADGLVGSDSVTVTASGTFADANAGVGKVVTISGITLSGAQSGNYTVSDSSQSSAADISPRAITLQSKSLSKVYDGNALKPGSDEDKLVAVTSGKIVTGETLTYTFTGSQTDVGTSDNTFTATDSATALAANYAISYDYGKLTVTVPATVGDDVKDLTAGNVTPSDKEKIEKALEEVKKYLDMSPSEDEKKELEAKKAQYEALLKQIDRVTRAQKGSLLATGDEARGKLWLGLFVLSMSLGTGLLALIKRGKKR